MKSEQLVRINLWELYPPFVSKIQQLLENCFKLNAEYYAYSGYRSYDEQAAIYAKGRTVPCVNCVAKGLKDPKCGHFETKAPPGWSAHNYGFAVDFALDGDLNKKGLQPDWDAKSYDLLAKEAEKLGLEAGQHWASFKDSPHIQVPLTKLGIKWPTLILILEKGGLKAVCAYLDKFKF